MSSLPVKPTRIRILVVEDEAVVARDICQQLREQGYDPVANTATGEAAIDLAGQHRPDLVLMDIHLAGEMDGITAARTIRERFALPVVFLTAFSGRETLERAREAEPFGYIIKPFDEQDLRTVIEMAVFKHRAEARQRASEARYRALTESAHDGIITVDAAGNIANWNRGATHIFGYTASAILGQSLSLLLPARFRADHHGNVAHVMSGAEHRAIGQTIELVGLHQDGHEFPLELSLARWETPEGRFVTAIVRDITERRRTEDQLRRLTLFPELNPNPVLAFEADGSLSYANPAALVMAQKLGLDDVPALLPKETPRFVAACLQSGEPLLRLETAVGSHTVSWSFYPQIALQMVHCYAGDITERKRTEERMRLQSAALEAAVNSVVITDTAGTIQWVNPAFCQITGYTKEEAVGQNPRVLKSGHQPSDYYAEMWRTITAGRSWRGEFVNRRKDGTLYTENVTITPVRDADGRIRHYVAIKQDISALKQSIAELNAAHAELAEKNVVLQNALVEARAAVEAKASFLATMSHEIRTPMNGVLGIASLLRATAPLTPEQLDYIETIHSSGDTLLALINDVLDYSKIDSVHLDLERVPFDLRLCLEETLEALAPRAQQKHLDLAAQIDDAVPATIVGDAVRLRQVLTNLVGNALKFTEHGEVVIEVSATPAAEGQALLRFSVRDTGIGIPPDKIGRLFKAFSQGDTSTTRIYGGTGLGLVISQRLVQLMGGHITVESQPGVGTMFAFALTVPTGPALAQAAPSLTPAELADRRVLIVDDNATNRHIFAAQLRHAGMRPTEAASAAAGLDWLRSHPWPDLIITDMLMPQVDGLDFVLAVRALENLRAAPRPLPILLISSGGYQPSDPRNATAHLAAALSKPVRQQQLIDAVARACALAPSPRPASPDALAPAAELQRLAAAHPCRILLAEDNPVNRKVALGMLARLGYSATVAVHGLAAVEACRTAPFDLVFMDVQMPELDGLAATRRIRALPGHRPLIVAMTANALEGDRAACLAAGMDDYLAKPIRLEDLQRAVATACQHLAAP
jgi:PAS domain S-box-containing protein